MGWRIAMRDVFRRLNNRFRTARPGSVLILVVALLVLMALLGTAFLSTTRVDRYTSIQHTNNTEIDLLVEGVKNMAKSTIVGDLMDLSTTPHLRPSPSNKYATWTMPQLL